MIYAKNKAVWVSKNFKSTEFDCNCKKYCNTTNIDMQLVKYLQQIRDHFQKPVLINSAYRCEKHNKSVGGANKSKHLYGQAADIKINGVKPLKIAQYAESIGIKGIGLYDNFVHVDTRSNKFFWQGSEQKEKTTFGTYMNEAANQITHFTDDAITPPSTSDIVPNNNTVTVIGESVNIRKGPGTSFEALKLPAVKGNIYKKPNVKGWVPIVVDNAVYWISEKYIK